MAPTNRFHVAATLGVALVVVTVTSLATAVVDAAPYTGPVKLLTRAHYGRQVNQTETEKHAGPELEDLCSVGPGSKCQPGKESTIAGGYSFPQGVAVQGDPANPDQGNVYIADTANARVQELTPGGGVVRVFGWDVDKTKVEKGAPQTERNVCAPASGDVCQAGTEGGQAEQLSGPHSITVDEETGNVYIQDLFNWRIDEYTYEGHFVLMVGKDVNETKQKEGAPQAADDVCTASSGDVCQAGERAALGTEAGAFNFAQGLGDLIAVGGPEHLLYVGDEHRVQEFNALTGSYVREIPLTSISSEPEARVVALSVEHETGVVYLAYGVGFGANHIYEFEGTSLIRTCMIRGPTHTQATVSVEAMALDSLGRLAVMERELGSEEADFGAIYDPQSCRRVTEFTNPNSSGIALYRDGATPGEPDRMYAVVLRRQEVVGYSSVHVADLSTEQESCKLEGVSGSERLATATCELTGFVNPDEVPATASWFEWGETSLLGNSTAHESVNAPKTITTTITGLAPDATYYDRLSGEDENVKSPELLNSDTLTFETPLALPTALGEPTASFVSSSSAVLHGELNPENSLTSYGFEYAPAAGCEQMESELSHPIVVAECPGRHATQMLESSAYAAVGATLETEELQAGTAYRYRLMATNEREVEKHKEGGSVFGSEATFTTAQAPRVDAITTGATDVSATSAMLSGIVVSGGRTAAYRFEIGAQDAGGAHLGVVFSGSVAGSSSPATVSLPIGSLQPATEYVYRLTVSSGYGSASGALSGFTTAGLPEVLTPLAPSPPLAIPAIRFPVDQHCKRGYRRNSAGNCVKQRKKAARKKLAAKKQRRARRAVRAKRSSHGTKR